MDALSERTKAFLREYTEVDRADEDGIMEAMVGIIRENTAKDIDWAKIDSDLFTITMIVSMMEVLRINGPNGFEPIADAIHGIDETLKEQR